MMDDLLSSSLSRRAFLRAAAVGCVGVGAHAAVAAEGVPGAAEGRTPGGSPLVTVMDGLLRDWCDGLIRLQFKDASRPESYGAFQCPGCGFIHGRCGDAVYPLLHMARKTGRREYLDAGIAAFEWTRNVDSPDGAWTNDLDPKSWKGITVFGSIALAEAIGRHGDLLEDSVRERWMARLRRAADYIHSTFDMETGNINYGLTATYGLALLGHLFNEPRYIRRSHELAGQAGQFLTDPNRLIFGEGRPTWQKTAKGCLAVDLGYNVEESLPALAMYGLLEKDEAMLRLATQSLASHLQFMLPDGAWDNSWGTRSYKWTYWGSRTSDGCSPAFALLSDRHPAFGAAALRNTQLLRACTHEGLLYGGPHSLSHGVKPCVHHTFCHAKALATVLDRAGAAQAIDASGPLPREAAEGVTEFPEVVTWLVARGPWRATVTGYDWVYHGDVFHATGGALAMLWHRQLGPLLAASLADYSMVEPKNMQPSPDGQDISLTPHVELREGQRRFSHLYDLRASVSHRTRAGAIEFTAKTRLVDARQADPPGRPILCDLTYQFTRDRVMVRSQTSQASASAGLLRMVLPLVSEKGERVQRVSDRRFEVAKPGGIVVIECSRPLQILETGRDRVFNHVPGFEAIPFAAHPVQGTEGAIEYRISQRR